MAGSPGPRAASGRDETPRGSRGVLVAAWVSALLVLVAIPVGGEAETAFLEARGYGTAEVEPPGLGLLGFALFATIVLVPATAATWFGYRAFTAGRRSGAAASVLALVTGGGLVLITLAAHLSRLVGWMVVLGTAVVLGSLALVVARRHGMPTRRPRG